MKTKHLFTIVLLSIFSLSLFTMSCNQGSGSKNKNVAEVTFTTTIDCPNCQKKVETKLASAEGVKEFKVNLSTQEVWVKYAKDQTDVAKLIEVIGYEAVEKE